MDDHVRGMVAMLHEDAIELAVRSSATSATIYGQARNDIIRDAMFILLHDAVISHRAIATLVVSGWTSSAAPLIRTILDLNISALAILNGEQPSLNAFRYFYSGLRRLSRDPMHPGALRKRLRAQLRERISALPENQRAAALQFLKGKDRAYWFAEEWKTPIEVLNRFSAPEVEWTYQQFSAAAHGGFIGMRLLREQLDELEINPQTNVSEKSLFVLMMSTRFVVEMVSLRNDYEQLGLETECQRMRDQLASLQRIVYEATRTTES